MRDSIKRESLEWVKALGIGLIIFVVIRTFLFSNYVVEGESMMPTLEDGNKLVVNKIGYQVGELHRYDVVVFHASETEDYVKRIIGLPGDTVEYKDDKLYVNGESQPEPYLEKFKEEMVGTKLTGDFTLEEITGEQTVPEGKVFVLGDNRRSSMDSRYFGFVDQDQIVGKVNMRYWPLNEFDVQFGD